MTALTPAEIAGVLRAAGCVFAEDEADLILSTARNDADAARMVERRAAGEPLEYVLGWAAFHGLRIEVDPGVFVPRRRTEYLVDQAVLLGRRGALVVDLCCGTGALGVAVASALPDVELYAADVEPIAVGNARRNVERFRGEVFEGDLFEALPSDLRGRIDLLLCNVPYVPTDEVRFLPAEARLHEPLVTLDGGPDGLAVLRRVAAEAANWLAPAGHVVFETTEAQATAAVEFVAAHGLTARATTSEHLGATVVIGTRPR